MPKLIIIIILIGLSAVFSYFLVLPQYNDLTVLKSQVLDKQEELYSREEYISQLRGFSDELKNHQQAVDKINYAFPEKADVPEVLLFLEQAASTNGLVIEEISVSAESKEASASLINSKVRERRLNVSFSGNVESLVSFLAEVEQSARLLQIGSLSFEYIEDELNAGQGIFPFEVVFEIRSWSDELAGSWSDELAGSWPDELAGSWPDELAEGEDGSLLPVLEPKEISIDFDFLSSSGLKELNMPEQVLLPEEIGRENPFIPY